MKPISAINLTLNTSDVDSLSSGFVFYAVSENSSRVSCSTNAENLIFIPSADWFGTTYCNLTAGDGADNSTISKFNISVANVNDAPTITSAAIISASEDFPYVYQITTTDKDNLIVQGTDNLTYSLSTSPSGMVINSTSGLIGWIPNQSDVGNKNVFHAF